METWLCPLISFFAFLIKLLHESLKSMRNFIFCGIFFFQFSQMNYLQVWFTFNPYLVYAERERAYFICVFLRLQTV